MNRRGFLGLIGAAISTAVLDQDKLLWRPGVRLISIPKVIPEIAEPTASYALGDIFTIEGFHQINPMTGRSLDTLQKFVVTKSCSSGLIEFKRFFPPIIGSGQFANVHKEPWVEPRRIQPYLVNGPMAYDESLVRTTKLEMLWGQNG